MSYPPATDPNGAPQEQPAQIQEHAAQGGQPYAAPQAPAAAYQAQPQQAPTALPTTLAYTNTFALVSIVTAFLSPIAGIVFGHLALGQIKRNGDAGRGIALTGLILGYAYFAFIILFVIFYISMIGIMFASFGAAFSDFGGYGDYDTW